MSVRLPRPGWLAAFILLVTLALSTAVNARRRPRVPLIKTFPASSPATLLHLVDADSAWLQIHGVGRIKARFYGINAPECHKRQVRTAKIRSARCVRDDEHFGRDAYVIAKAMMTGKKLILNCPRNRKTGRCRTGGFGRVLVTIEADGVDVMEQLVTQGAAWTFTKYPATNRKRLCRLENQARDRKTGMWAIGRARVQAKMHAKTRRWYAQRDKRCDKRLRGR